MDRTRENQVGPPTAEVIDFDEALLAAVAPAQRAALIDEAAMLARAFAPDGDAEDLRIMAASLTIGAQDPGMDPARARQLASALRCLARGMAR